MLFENDSILVDKNVLENVTRVTEIATIDDWLACSLSRFISDRACLGHASGCHIKHKSWRLNAHIRKSMYMRTINVIETKIGAIKQVSVSLRSTGELSNFGYWNLYQIWVELEIWLKQSDGFFEIDQVMFVNCLFNSTRNLKICFKNSHVITQYPK